MVLRDLKARLDPDAPEPLALQLVRLLACEIRDGRMQAGTALPGSRAIAGDLGISRHMVMSALRELELEGWVTSRAGSGTYVSDTIPEATPRAWGALPEALGIPESPAFSLPSQLSPVSSVISEGFDISESLPDVRLAPKDALAKGYQRALRRHGDDLLGRGEPRGNLALRENLAEYLCDARGMKIKAENLLITRGTAMALTLIATALLPRGGDIAVENPGNPAIWAAFRAMPGIRLHPISVDDEGLEITSLETRLERQRLDFLYLSPQHQIPTTVTLAPERRSRLLNLAKERGFAILEDDAEFEYCGASGPLLPLASGDPEGRVIHLGSLAQLLAPGLSLGYLVAPKALVDRLARVRQRMEAQGDRVLEWAVADLIRDGDLERHLARVRQIYAARRETYLELIPSILGSGFSVNPSNGGLACWIRTPETQDLSVWSIACRKNGVKFHPGHFFDISNRSLPYLRLGLGGLETSEARTALERMRASYDNLQA